MAYSPAQIAHTKGGDPFLIDLNHADLAREYSFAANAWGQYRADANLTVGATVSPTFNADGTSKAGNWYGGIPLFQLPVYTSAHITYDAPGVSMAYSLDNQQTWIDFQDYVVIPLTTANKTLDIRASFAGGVVADTSVVNSINVYVFKAGVITQESGTRTLTIGQDQITDKGVLTAATGCAVSAAAGGGTLDPQGPAQIGAVDYSVGAIEAWVIMTPGAAVFPGLPPATIYTNGVQGVPNGNSTSAQHVVAVLTTPANVGFTIGPNVTLSHFATYQTQLTAADVVSIYESNINGMPTMVILDDDGLTVTETDNPVEVYAYNWSIVSAGR